MTNRPYDKTYEDDFNKIFSKNLKRYLSDNNMTQLELAKKLGVGTTSVYNWCNGIKTPRMGKVDAMCSLFHCRRSDLMEDKSSIEEFLPIFSEEEELIINAFRKADAIDKAIVLRTLHLDEEDSGEKNKLA